MPLVLGGSAVVTPAYSVDNSCQFDFADGAYMSRSQGTPTGTGTKATFSAWLKLGTGITADANDRGVFRISDSGANAIWAVTFNTQVLTFGTLNSGSWNGRRITERLFRDPTAWYHLVCTLDTTQAVANDRMKMYINGTQETSFSTTTNPTQDSTDTALSASSGYVQHISSYTHGGGAYFDGYMAEVCFIDGTAYAASDFGEFDSDSPTIWKPKDVSELTFGDQGFYLDFEDSDNLGDDESGNTNDLTEYNIAAIDQCLDSPTNNYCTISPLTGARTGYTWSYCNTKVVTPSTQSGVGGTMGVSNGKWYFESYLDVKGSVYMGWQDLFNEEADGGNNPSTYWNTHGVIDSGNTGDIYIGGGSGSGFKAFDGTAALDYFGFAYDADNKKMWWSRNGQWYTANANPATTLTRVEVAANTDGYDCTLGTPPSFNANSRVGPFIGNSTNTQTSSFNFGNGRFGAINLTGTTYADNNGQGIFKYEPPDGFRAICSKNLGEFG